MSLPAQAIGNLDAKHQFRQAGPGVVDELPIAAAAPPNRLDRLLATARAAAAGVDSWVRPELRAAFAARVKAGDDPLGECYSRIRSAKERRTNGVTLTPPRIIEAMLRWAAGESHSAGSPARIVDPGAGSGRFAMAAAGAFADARVVAIENDPELLALLRANLRIAGLEDRVSVVAADFRSLVLPPIDGPTLFLGNPPYVRHHLIAADWKRWYAEQCAAHGIAASRLAGMHLHFFAKIAEIGRSGDYGCLITAAEWLDVGYGDALRKLLANSLGGTEIHVLQPTAEAFPGTMTTAAIIGFRIGRRPSGLRIRIAEKPNDLDRLEGGRKVSWTEASRSRKWSLLIRAVPPPPSGMVELGELCRVHRGQVTGANRIWIAGAHAAGLPKRFLKPTVTRAAELIAAEPSLDDDRHLARVVDLPASLEELDPVERGTIKTFIEWARSTGGADGYVARHRTPWWAVRLLEPAPILCTYMARRPPAFVRNRASARLLNIAHGIYPREPMTEEQLRGLAAALRATASREDGRTYAGGLIKFEPREVERLLIPRPDRLFCSVAGSLPSHLRRPTDGTAARKPNEP